MKEVKHIERERTDHEPSFQFSLTKPGVNDEVDRVQRSALWAAYGDALGWISELTNSKGLARRTGGSPLQHPIEWRRRIGGRGGVTVTLPKGCYSDDSQLRLATCRAIRSDGFDVEAFSKVELPVWLSYALGNGRSTSAAARNLSRHNVQWYLNKFKGWTNSGGNGAAMRIQPHVWAARDPGDPSTFLNDVVHNAICTHSHPNGILGAALHALSLAHAMVTGYSPEPEELVGSLERVSSHLDEFLRHDDVGQIWKASYEQEAGSFREAWQQSYVEAKEAIEATARTRNLKGNERYEAIIKTLGLRKQDRLGSGLLTAVAAVGLTWCETNPERALILASNAIGTDTDTIATMSGAILGVNAPSEPPVEVMDADLFRSEATRMYEISIGRDTDSFRYPDLLHWTAPKTQADALVATQSEEYHVLGLGSAKPVGQTIRSSNPGFMWQWVVTRFGQNLLIKRREMMRQRENGLESPADNAIDGSADQFSSGIDVRKRPGTFIDSQIPSQTAVTDTRRAPGSERASVSQNDLQLMIDYLERYDYDDSKIGTVFRRIADNCTVDQAHWFSAVLFERLRKLEGTKSARPR